MQDSRLRFLQTSRPASLSLHCAWRGHLPNGRFPARDPCHAAVPRGSQHAQSLRQHAFSAQDAGVGRYGVQPLASTLPTPFTGVLRCGAIPGSCRMLRTRARRIPPQQAAVCHWQLLLALLVHARAAPPGKHPHCHPVVASVTASAIARLPLMAEADEPVPAGQRLAAVPGLRCRPADMQVDTSSLL